MKVAVIGLLCLGLGVMQTLAAPAQNNAVPRQNDVPKCEDGTEGPDLFDMYDNAHCDNQCTYEEGSGDNKGEICSGQCKLNQPPPVPGGPQLLPLWYCSGTWDD